MAKGYDKNLQLINNLDIQMNIYKMGTLKLSVLRNFANDFGRMNNMTYSDSDIEAVCEALEFMDVTVVDDGASSAGASVGAEANEVSRAKACASSAAASEPTQVSDAGASAGANAQPQAASSVALDGAGVSYNDIELKLNELLHPTKPDFSALARTRSSAELCKMILDDPENYIKVMYAIRKQL